MRAADRRLWLLALLTGCHTQCSKPSDDPLEPNNDAAHATRLERGAPVTARSVEGDRDVWSFDAQAGEHLIVTVKPFVIFGEITLADPAGATLATDKSGTTVDAGWSHELDVTKPGTYTVTVMQGSAADNQFWFKWDYTIEVAAR